MSISINIRSASEELVESTVNKIAVVFPNLHARGIVKSTDNYFFCNINIDTQLYPAKTLVPKKSRVKSESKDVEQDSLNYVNKRMVFDNDRV